MMAEGSSFSGRERNTVFLNSGDGRFADVSGISGFDFLDDARGIALTDFDRDGDIDFWVSNRSGPRLRLMRNRCGSPGDSVGIHLQGTQCNRDAIGARVEVGNQQRSLRAGEGFLSQSSKWLHFGGVRAGSPVTVHWPGGKAETFGEVAPGGRYALVQGAGEATLVETARPAFPETVPAQVVPEITGTARVPLVARLPAPPFSLEGAESREVIGQGKPVLLNLWATWCAPCVAELASFAELPDSVTVLAVCIDDPDGTAAAVLEKAGYAGLAATGDESLATRYDYLQRSVTQRQLPMPAPTSFLIDGDGDVAVIYKGVVDLETLTADLAALGLEGEARRAWAAPAPGRWLHGVPRPNPLRFALKLFDAGRTEEAEAALLQFIGKYPESTNADIYFTLGRFRAAANNLEGERAAYIDALKLDSRHRNAHLQLADLAMRSRAYAPAARHFAAAAQLGKDADVLGRLSLAKLAQGKFADAEVHARDALVLAPGDADASYNLALALQRQGSTRFGEAADAYTATLALDPGRSFAANNLAWIRSTAPDPAVRDGAEAARLALPLTTENQPIFWMTYAAALAETGDFGGAIAAAQKALGMADANGGLARKLNVHLRHYAAGQPVREGS